jgi:RsiW-degrading membrane proteinase PrsW (M82 family)
MEYDFRTLTVLSGAAAVLPTLLYVLVIYSVDRYEKEPGWLLTATFLWGAVPSVLLALLFNAIGVLPFYLFGAAVGDAAGAVLIAPPVEEAVKAIALIGIFLLLRHEIDSLLDGIIYGAMVGMGFAMVENFLYFVSVYEQAGVEAWRLNILLRALVFGLNHALFASMTGLGLAVARFARRRSVRIAAPILGWTAAVLLHAVHNLGATFADPLCLLLPLADWGGVWLMIAIIIWALWQERQWIRRYLKEEVARGTMTLGQYERACSSRARLSHRLQLLFRQGPRAYLSATRYYRHCSELAYKKHHITLSADEKSAELIQQLRLQLADLSRDL